MNFRVTVVSDPSLIPAVPVTACYFRSCDEGAGPVGETMVSPGCCMINDPL